MTKASLCVVLLLVPWPRASAATAATADESGKSATGSADAEEGESSPPKIKKQTKPRYPEAALKERLEGEVLVEFLIDDKGRVVRTRILRSVPGLDEAAVKCVLEWRFRPAMKRGKPVATIAQVPVRFRIY